VEDYSAARLTPLRWNWFDPMLASEIRKHWPQGLTFSLWRWRLNEVFVQINGERRNLWQVVSQVNEVLESFVVKRWKSKVFSKLYVKR
jgi:putative transposase